ncbi:MAG: hypothetical protein MJE12_30530 [Alphaproteobacteria bacterium]|nr:hypothetical protein [Alphaproteobacteria bacterium]
MTQPNLIISFSEGDVEPLGKYGFELDLTAQNGCDVLEQLLFLVRSLNSPYQVLAGAQPVLPEEVDEAAYRKLTVWTNDKSNADFLLLMSELGVTVERSE